MALLNPQYLKSIVAIGINSKKKFECHATGFLVGFLAKNSKDLNKRQYYVFLVTNAHVFRNKEKVALRFNTKDGGTKVYEQELIFPNNERRWLSHRYKDVDLALLNVDPEILNSHKIDYKIVNEELHISSSKFESEGISVGDEVYIVGFPLGVSGEIQNYPYAKQGIISRKDKEIVRATKCYLVDSSVFPGNSGGPVFFKPTVVSVGGTKSVRTAYCLGVVKGYLKYREELYSLRTDTPSVSSWSLENSGLSFVVPMEYVKQIFNNWKSKNKTLEESRKEEVQQSIAEENQ